MYEESHLGTWFLKHYFPSKVSSKELLTQEVWKVELSANLGKVMVN